MKIMRKVWNSGPPALPHFLGKISDEKANLSGVQPKVVKNENREDTTEELSLFRR